VRRTKLRRHFRVGFGTLILVFDPHQDWCAERLAIERAGKNLHGVRLLAWCDDSGLAGTAAIQIGLDVGLGQTLEEREVELKFVRLRGALRRDQYFSNTRSLDPTPKILATDLVAIPQQV
jgi:hypothetical protein